MSSRRIKIFIFYLLVVCAFCEGYKIFVYSPKFSTSHVNFMGKIADILMNAGHDVIVYSPQILDDVYTNGTKLARVVVRPRDFDVLATTHDGLQDGMWTGDNEGFLNMQKIFHFISNSHGNLCKAQFADTTLLNSLEAEKFDIAIGENFDLCFYGVVKRIGVHNFITVFSTTQYENGAMALGIPSTPSFVPGIFTGMKPPFTYRQRITNLIAHLFSWLVLHKSVGDPANNFLKTIYGNGFDAMEEMSKSAFYFTNADEHVDFPRPITHKIIYVGGLGKVQSKPLDKKFDEIMKNSKKGVIMVSFGTVAKSTSMPEKTKRILLDTFANFPDITFLWKYENESEGIAKNYPNVIISKWLPQHDLLDHPKLLGFVSHGGMNSVQEGASKGVPMIMIPLFHDQMRNSESLAYRKMAIVLEKHSLSVGTFSSAIQKIIDDESYRKNAKRMAAMIAAKPMDAEERVVKYTEFAAAFGPDLNLDMYGKDLSFVQFYCLDIIMPVSLIILFIVFVVFQLFLYILKKLFNSLGVYKSKLE